LKSRLKKLRKNFDVLYQLPINEEKDFNAKDAEAFDRMTELFFFIKISKKTGRFFS
jgi:hypothetical protein